MRHLLVGAVVGLLVLAVMTLSHSQTSAKLQWTHDGNADRFELRVDGTLVALSMPTPQPGTTTYQVQLPTLSPAPHTFVVSACNVIACAASQGLAYGPPTAPAGLRLVP